MIRKLISALVLGSIAGTLVISVAAAGDGSLPPDWRAVRAATARFHSLAQAQRDGYEVAGQPCISSPAGTMGVHAINWTLLMDPAIDPLQPEGLLYAPNQDGQLKLVGVEYLKADADGSLATDGDRPSVFGTPFDGPMPGHGADMPVHYDLHVWIAERNPNGLSAQWNPAISC